jgi:hypothetical protein
MAINLTEEDWNSDMAKNSSVIITLLLTISAIYIGAVILVYVGLIAFALFVGPILCLIIITNGDIHILRFIGAALHHYKVKLGEQNAS